MASGEGANKRHMKRRYLIYYLRVFDRESGELLGHLVDITEEGIMIMREKPLEVGKSFQLRLRWRNADGRLQVIDFDGVSRWCRPDVNPDFHGAGFSITTQSENDVATIRQLIQDLGMPS